jgi:hypothetical protein
LAAADFFTVEVLTMAGLVRYVVLFVMELKTRTVQIAGITRQPDGDWMRQTARNLTDAHDGFLRDMHYVILDRDPLYIAAFRDLLRDSGVKQVDLAAGRDPRVKLGERAIAGNVPRHRRHLRHPRQLRICNLQKSKGHVGSNPTLSAIHKLLK